MRLMLTVHSNSFLATRKDVLTLHENELVGSVPSLICLLVDDPLSELTADCDEIECSCCTECF